MAVFRWRGNGAGTKTAWNDGRNWVDNAGGAYAQAIYPGSSGLVSDDEVIFDAALGSTDSAPAGYTVATKLARLAVMPAYNQGIGSELAPVILNADQMTIQASAAKTLYVNAGGEGFDNLTIIDGSYSGAIRALEVVVLKGKVTILNGSAVSSSFLIGYISSQTGDAKVTIQAGVTLPVDTRIYGGSISCNSSLFFLTVTGGAWSQEAGAIQNTVTIYSGTVLWNGSGYLERLDIYGGTFDCSNSQNSRKIGIAAVHPAGYLNLDSGSETVIIQGHIENEGGRIDYPMGSKMARAFTDNFCDPGSGVPYGIEPQMVNNGVTVTGGGFRCGGSDKVVCFCMIGSGGVAGGSVIFTLYASADNTFSGESAVGSVEIESQHSGGTIEIDSSDFPPGKRWLRVKAENQFVGGVPALATCQAIIRTP